MKAIILLSGGLDSAVILAMAVKLDRECLALSFDYNQRHRIELDYASKLAEYYGIPHQIIKIDPSFFKNTKLVKSEPSSQLPSHFTATTKVPSTYVPARNTLFLSYAMGLAEIWEAQEIHFGPNAADADFYVDCRPDYVNAIQQVARLATKQGAEGNAPKIVTPLMHMSKEEIAFKAFELNLPIEMTWSCYDPQGQVPCQVCNACILRQKALQECRA